MGPGGCFTCPSSTTTVVEAVKLKFLALELSPATRHKEEEKQREPIEHETNNFRVTQNWGLCFSNEEEVKGKLKLVIDLRVLVCVGLIECNIWSDHDVVGRLVSSDDDAAQKGVFQEEKTRFRCGLKNERRGQSMVAKGGERKSFYFYFNKYSLNDYNKRTLGDCRYTGPKILVYNTNISN